MFTTRTKAMSAVLLVLVLSIGAVGLPAMRITAQEPEPLPPAVFGDPPRANLISISEPDEDGIVVIRGQVGAVFPGAVVAIRNMYTGQTVYPRAEITGAFFGEIYGPGNTPFWISPATRVDPTENTLPGSLPGGPGVIVYGPFPEAYNPPPLPVPLGAEAPVTPVVIDGDGAEWPDLLDGEPIGLAADSDALLYTLANNESLYLAVVPVVPEQLLPVTYVRMEIDLEMDGRLFRVRLDPRRGGGGYFYEVAPNLVEQNLGPLGGLSAQQMIPGGAVELRLPRTAFTGWAVPVTVQALRFVTESCCGEGTPAGMFLDLEQAVPEYDELDERTVRPLDGMPGDAVPFTLSGPVGGGSGLWHAYARLNQLDFAAGDSLLLEMQVEMQVPEAPGGAAGLLDAGLRLGADLRLEPVTVNGAQTVADHMTGNGWSGILTPSGLPVENVAGGVRLGDATARSVVATEDRLTFLLQWAIPLDAAIPAGQYALALDGYAAVNGLYGTWADAGLLGDGPGAGVAAARLPVVLRIGDTADSGRLLWTLFQDMPASSGARGLVAQEDQADVAVSGHVAFGGGTYIVPRTETASDDLIPYALEPYLPALLGNSYYETVAPLIPFVFDSGSLAVRVTLPDGSEDDLGTVPLLQNTLSSAERDEAQAFGAASPLDVYRLTTLNPRFMDYTFEQSGHHVVTMTGTITDIWGRTYEGGGSYDVWVAEPFQMLTGTLPGTPFEAGDVYNPALAVVPAYPADVTVNLTVFPLDGSDPVQYETSGQANRYGYFYPQDDAFTDWMLEQPGEYVVDVTASYTDARGKLWMGSTRGAGLIATPQSDLVARGGRGVSRVALSDQLAWYALDHVELNLLTEQPQAGLHWPYNSGDVLWGRNQFGRISAGLNISDPLGLYQAWLLDHAPDWTADNGLTLRQLGSLDELPVVTTSMPDSLAQAALSPEGPAGLAYAYLNAVRPGVTVRQLVLGDEAAGMVRAGWDFDDPYNGQAGTGINGDLPGDYTFLFGGAVLRPDETTSPQAVIYGALAMTIDPDDPRGDRVYPPFMGAANGADGGPLLVVRDDDLEMFFASTGFQPGQLFTVGETLALAGQVAPTLPALVEAEVVTPSGRVLRLGGRANAVGYYYDPSQNLALFEPGIWHIRLQVSYDGQTSVGAVQEPYPTGSVIGAPAGEFDIYVLPEDAEIADLDTPTLADGFIPTALPFNVNVTVPFDWDDVQLNYTVLMNGTILDTGVQPAFGDIFAYNYDPRRLNEVFPNLDITLQDTFTPYSADAVQMTFVLSGTTPEGARVMSARLVTLFGDRLLTVYEGWPPPRQ